MGYCESSIVHVPPFLFCFSSTDPRVEDWLLMQSPFPSLLLCVGYLIMCYVGPRMMATRRPFELKPILILYNFVMVLLSAYMFYEVMPNSDLLGLSIREIISINWFLKMPFLIFKIRNLTKEILLLQWAS